MSRWLRSWPVWLAAGTLVASCRQVAGIDDRVRCPAVDRTDGCGDCLAGACCPESAACASDADCGDLQHCVASCAPDDDPCRAACRSGHPAAASSTFAAIASCEARACAPACGETCGGWIYPGANCRTCTEQNCCSEATACAGSVDCTSYSACARSCDGDSDCDTHCEDAFSKGMEAATALGLCVEARCGDVCATGWSCIGAPEKPSSLAAEFSLTFGEVASNAPLVGATFRACEKLDADCASPVASTTTDAHGYVTLELASGFDGYFEVFGGMPEPAPAILVWTGEPLHGQYNQLQYFVAVTTLDALTNQFLQLSPDPEKGQILLTALDCTRKLAPKVSFALDGDPAAVQFYMSKGVPSRAATETDTSKFGATGGFANVTPGSVLVSARTNVLDTTYVERPIPVRKGWVTFAQMAPIAGSAP